MHHRPDPTRQRPHCQRVLTRRSPRLERHPHDELQDHHRVLGIRLRSLQQCVSKVLHRPRVRHHNFHSACLVKSQRQLQPVHPRGLHRHPRCRSTPLQRSDHSPVPCPVIRKPQQLHHTLFP